MSHLVLELRPGELMVVNGATIRFRSKCRLELVSHARFLFGKQIMELHEAETTVRQLYYHLQIAYVGPVDERTAADRAVKTLFKRLRQDPTYDSINLAEIEDAFVSEEFYRALKLLRLIMQDEKLTRAEYTGASKDLVKTDVVF